MQIRWGKPGFYRQCRASVLYQQQLTLAKHSVKIMGIVCSTGPCAGKCQLGSGWMDILLLSPGPCFNRSVPPLEDKGAVADEAAVNENGEVERGGACSTMFILSTSSFS